MIIIQTPVIFYGCDFKTFYHKLEIITKRLENRGYIWQEMGLFETTLGKNYVSQYYLDQ